VAREVFMAEKTITVKREWLEAVATLTASCAALLEKGQGTPGQPLNEILRNLSRAVKETIRIHTQ